MSKSPSSRGKANQDFQDPPSPRNRRNISRQDEDDENYDERERIRQKLIQDAKDLLDYVTVEMTVDSQMESTKKNIKEMSKRCREESRMIYDLENQIREESSKKDKIEEGEVIDEDHEEKEIDVILELEKELKALYQEKAALLNKKQKK